MSETVPSYETVRTSNWKCSYLHENATAYYHSRQGNDLEDGNPPGNVCVVRIVNYSSDDSVQTVITFGTGECPDAVDFVAFICILA